MNIYTNKAYDDAKWKHNKKMEEDPEYRAKELKVQRQKDCYHCKKIISIDFKFCPHCGK